MHTGVARCNLMAFQIYVSPHLVFSSIVFFSQVVRLADAPKPGSCSTGSGPTSAPSAGRPPIAEDADSDFHRNSGPRLKSSASMTSSSTILRRWPPASGKSKHWSFDALNGMRAEQHSLKWGLINLEHYSNECFNF